MIRIAQLLAAGFLIGVLSVYSQDLSTDTVRQGNCNRLQEVYLRRLIASNKPGGLVIVNEFCETQADILESSSEESLDESLDRITQDSKHYEWKDEQGVVNLFPKSFSVDLLQVNITEFKVTNIDNLPLLMDKLLQLPEITMAQARLGLKPGMNFGGLSSPPRNRPPVELVFVNTTLRDILNEIVRKRGRGVWLYKEYMFDGANVFVLDFVVH
jgi:hypothetical protein